MNEVLRFHANSRNTEAFAKRRVVQIQFDSNGDVHTVTDSRDSGLIWLAQVVSDGRILPGEARWDRAPKAKPFPDRNLSSLFD